MAGTGGEGKKAASPGASVSGWRETMRVYIRDPEIAAALDSLGRGLASVVLLAGRRRLAEDRLAGFIGLQLQAAASDLEHVAGFLRGIGEEQDGGEEGSGGRLTERVEEVADEVLRLAAEVERVAVRLRSLADAGGGEGGGNRGGEAPGGGAR